jgi:YHS domain-containing protein
MRRKTFGEKRMKYLTWWGLLVLAACDSKPPPPLPPAPLSKPAWEPKDPTWVKAEKGDKYRDYVCGMVLIGQPKYMQVLNNFMYGFCSRECGEKFAKEPDKSKFKVGLPGMECVCPEKMAGCQCGHCKGAPERCPCWDPGEE